MHHGNGIMFGGKSKNFIKYLNLDHKNHSNTYMRYNTTSFIVLYNIGTELPPSPCLKWNDASYGKKGLSAVASLAIANVAKWRKDHTEINRVARQGIYFPFP